MGLPYLGPPGPFQLQHAESRIVLRGSPAFGPPTSAECRISLNAVATFQPHLTLAQCPWPAQFLLRVGVNIVDIYRGCLVLAPGPSE